MAKFTRLTRGVKLLFSHVFTPISSVLNLLTLDGVTADDYEKEYGTFRVNINIPYVNLTNKMQDESRNGTITVPFILPAYQDVWNNDNSEINDYELIEVSVSQDTRSEASRLLGIKTSNAVNEEGSQVHGEGNAYTFHLMEKELDSTSIGGGRVEKEIYKINIPEVALLDSFSRANPYVQTGISTQLRHDRSYLIEFTPEKALQPFFSVTLSLKLKHKLAARDVGASIQNMPSHLGAFNNSATAVTIPAGDSAISADSASGVNTGFALIDNIINRGLAGGYKKDGSRRYKENLKSDAGYEVIAVPMFGSWFSSQPGPTVGNPANDIWSHAYDLPWSSLAVGGLRTMDRAVIPLQYPMTIHHVLIAVNYTHGVRSVTGVRPTQASFTNEVGVGLMQGIRAEDYSVQQVAHLKWEPPNIATDLVDQFSSGGEGKPAYTYMWDILSCPLVGAGGQGYKPQGHPVYAAQGQTGTTARTNIGGAPPVTEGCEQALDIRWKISDAGNVATVNGVVVGWPGHWVYIIGKKHLI
tara:strand:- start:1562 stop:3139 length:1578 start_codon:yes stop_codon:yes gene_type:complete